MEEQELEEKSNWRIIEDTSKIPIRKIVNTNHPIKIPKIVYNCDTYTPVVLAPINRSSTLILSAYDHKSKLGLRIHDLRLVGDQIVGSISFTMRGSQYQLRRFKNEMNRVADNHRCVGVSYFLRKMFYGGFRYIMADRKLRQKEYSPLQQALEMVQFSSAHTDSKEAINASN